MMQLPPPDARRGLVTAYARVLARLERGERELVLPNGEYFPDVFSGDQASVQSLLDRLLEHAGLADMAIEARIWGDSAASCGTGACGSCGPSPSEPESEQVQRLVDAGDAWQINVLPSEVGSPIALSSALCRAISLAVLLESDEPPAGIELDAAVDLNAIALGQGVLLLEGSHMYRKSCGGPSIARSTALGPSEIALVLALDAAVHDRSCKQVGKYLSPTQAEAFSEARAWVDSNAPLVQSLKSDPELAARGQFELRDTSSWLGRWLGGKVRRAPRIESADTIEGLEAALASAPPRRSSSKPRDPKAEEIRRLVDEALGE